MNPRNRQIIRYLLGCWGGAILLFCALTALYAWHLNRPLKEKFDGRRWAIPARVYARPLEIYPGKKLQAGQLETELALAGYRRDANPASPGSYARQGGNFRIKTGEFDFGEGISPAVQLARPGLGLRGLVPRLPGAEDEHDVGSPLLEQQLRVLEAPGEHGRGFALVLGRAEDHDRVHPVDPARIVAVRRAPDRPRADGDDEESRAEHADGDGDERMAAENAHDLWAAQRLAQGWTYGPQRDDGKKQHPCLVPYAQLPEKEKEYVRVAALGTLKVILKLGYRILPPGAA